MHIILCIKTCIANYLAVITNTAWIFNWGSFLLDRKESFEPTNSHWSHFEMFLKRSEADASLFTLCKLPNYFVRTLLHRRWCLNNKYRLRLLGRTFTWHGWLRTVYRDVFTIWGKETQLDSICLLRQSLLSHFILYKACFESRFHAGGTCILRASPQVDKSTLFSITYPDTMHFATGYI